MNWTHRKVDRQFTDGNVIIVVSYQEESNPKLNFERTYKAERIDGIWPDNIIRRRLAELNALDLDSIPLDDTLKAEPVAVSADPELDVFLALLNTYRTKKSAFDSGLSKITAEEVDHAYDAMKQAFQERFAPYVKGLF